MFKAIRIGILSLVLLFVSLNAWLTQARSTDWNNSLWVKIYPINADGSSATSRYIESLEVSTFVDIEEFVAREAARYGRQLARPVRIELGEPVREQPPQLGDQPNVFDVMLWSIRMRWWASSVTDDQDRIEPDVSIFVRYHQMKGTPVLENSVGMQKGMFGIVNAYTGRRNAGRNNVIIAHEFFHTIGASDKYELGTGQPLAPHGLAEPDRSPLYPQRYAEIMGGRVALAEDDAVIPKSLQFAVIGQQTASEIKLTD
ncbi:MAG: hypothetical protein R3288_05005 [Woeseiaceae bacterium]|nr:hypothetical protein [Woeseiaceae bacterium]